MELINTDEISGLDDLLNDPRLKIINPLQSLPTKFEPITKRRFIVQVPGVDSWMVSCINEMPELKKSWVHSFIFVDNKILKCNGELKITYYSPISPSVIQQLTELIQRCKKIDIVLKQLDPLGTVISQRTFKKCKLIGFRLSNLSYDSGDLEKVLATFKCKYVSIDL